MGILRIFEFGLLLGVLLASGCGSGNPFRYVKVSGSVTYDDGSPIPADTLRLTFIPQAAAANEKTFPPAGKAIAQADGTFNSVTSHTPGDGLVAGKHKVLVIAFDDQQRPLAAVPPEYSDVARTPLEVDTAEQPFVLRVRKLQP